MTILLVVLTAGISGAAPVAAETSDGVRTHVSSHTSVAGQDLPYQALSGAWTVRSPRSVRLDVEGDNPPGTTSTLVGRVSIKGPLRAAGWCIVHQFEYSTYDGLSPGDFTQHLFIKRAQGKRIELDQWSSDYPDTIAPVLISIGGVFTDQLIGGTTLRRGDRLVLTTTTHLTDSTNGFTESFALNLRSCG